MTRLEIARAYLRGIRERRMTCDQLREQAKALAPAGRWSRMRKDRLEEELATYASFFLRPALKHDPHIHQGWGWIGILPSRRERIETSLVELGTDTEESWL